MKKSHLLLLSLFLGACTVSTAINIQPNQIYRGYPCGDHCLAFQKGFERAEQQNLTQETACSGQQLEEITGCKAYITEYVRTTPEFTDLNIK